MKVIIFKDSGIEKLSKSHRQALEKAINKMSVMLDTQGASFKDYTVNNPLIHDGYKKDFYMFKYLIKNFSIRILYRCDFNGKEPCLQIHRFHFKKGDRDNSKYIEMFENYVENFSL